MNAASRLFTLTAGDLMSRQVATLGIDDSLSQALQLFAKEQISGAPVVDHDGRCVGLLSSADLVRWAERRGNLALCCPVSLPRTCSYLTKQRDRFGKERIVCTLPTGNCPFQQEQAAPDGATATVCGQPNCVPTDWQVVEMNDTAPCGVRDFMTTDPVTANPGEAIVDIAQKMIDAHIHRIVVIDGAQRPIGIVSSTDYLAALVREFRRRD